jgi:hypothetical protein
MKKSTQVPATLIVTVAGFSIVGCNSRSSYDCVNAAGRVLNATECRNDPTARYIRRNVSYGGFGGGGYGGGGFFGG